MKKRSSKWIGILISIVMLASIALTACGEEIIETEPQKLASPTITLSDDMAIWEMVPYAVSYQLDINGETENVTNTFYSLAEYDDGEDYIIKVKAVGDDELFVNSDWSNTVTYKFVEEPPVVIPQRTLTFNTNGGQALADITTEEGEFVLLPTPYKENHIFAGWYADSALTTPYTSNIMPTANTTLYASYVVDASEIYNYNTTNDGRIITGLTEFGASMLTSIALPQTIKNKTVIAIAGNAFRENTNIVSVELPQTVTTIGENAFYGCTALTQIDLNQVESIGANAFNNCTALAQVTIPQTVEEIGMTAFSSVGVVFIEGELPATNGGTIFGSFIKAIVVPQSEENAVLDAYQTAWTSYASKIYAQNMLDIQADYMLAQDADTTSLIAYFGTASTFTIPNEIDTIASNAFYKCLSLESVTLGDDVKTIKLSAFAECANLVSVDLANVEIIESGAFTNCASYRVAFIPQTVTQIDAGAFIKAKVVYMQGETAPTVPYNAGCFDAYLPAVIVPEGMANAYKTATNWTSFASRIYEENTVNQNDDCIIFEDASVQTLIAYLGQDEQFQVPAGITKIGAYTFYANTVLTSIDFNEVEEIGERAFYGATGLITVDFADVTKIGNYAFYNCTNLTSIDLSSVQTIGDYAFQYCSKITTAIVIPQTVTAIGTYAFVGTAPAYFEFKGTTAPTVGYNGITDYTNRIVLYPEGASSAYASLASSYLKLYCITDLTAEGFIIADVVNTTNPYSGTTYKTVVAYLGTGENVVIPAGVQAIGAAAFSGNKTIKTITFSEGLIRIGYQAFSNCENLTTFTIPSTVTTIEGQAFTYCYGIESLYIPSTVINIGNSAFMGWRNTQKLNVEFTSAQIPTYSYGTYEGWAAYSGWNGGSAIVTYGVANPNA